ncbi:hypothetical protein AB0A63_05960 [Lentzea sp. NPDC042327]|uniref:hypothetical protein n=1 Tax=Lentzea sp. NPDC042327 TaxID=3154801 RepID=UPI0033F69590
MSEEKKDQPQPAAEEVPADAAPLSPDDVRRMSNVSHGDMHGMQTGDVAGDVNYYAAIIKPQADLIVRYAAPQDIEDVQREFVPPGGFASALAALRRDNVVVLCGPGTGRTFAARRLLAYELRVARIADMNRSRTLGTLRATELEPGTGVVLDVRDSRDRPFTDQDFSQCRDVLKDAGCHLVVLLDHLGQVPAGAAKDAVLLTAPAPVEVAQAELRRRGHAGEAEMQTLKDELAPALDGASPDKAVRAADLAVQIHEEGLPVAEALASLREEVTAAVARWFEELDVRAHAYSFAVAVLENQPYEHVMDRAWALDMDIRKARLAEGRRLRPCCVLHKPKDQLLREIRATTEVRAHPKHKDMFEETVRFERHDWARGVFKHMWRQYPAAHQVLRDWMSADAALDRFKEESAQAVCEVVRTVPAHEPLAIVENLALQRHYGRRGLAARALEVLMDDVVVQPLAEKALEKWVRSDSAYQKSTAARVYSSAFGRRDLTTALAKLTEIGKSEQYTPQREVVLAVLAMLVEEDIRGIALDTVVSWTAGRYRRTGLQPISLVLGLWVSGIYRTRHEYFVEFGRAFPKQVRDLLKHVLADEEFGGYVLEHLGELALHARWDAVKAAELVRLTRLIAPDLSWWRRRDAVDAVCFQHPAKRSEIQRIFRIACKVQKGRAQPS